MGDTTDPEPSENGMWFTIGFRQSWEAERALRRNGKIMDDTFMIGVARSVSGLDPEVLFGLSYLFGRMVQRPMVILMAPVLLMPLPPHHRLWLITGAHQKMLPPFTLVYLAPLRVLSVCH